jgi:hypothetical protein
MKGMALRMGQERRQNAPLTTKIIHAAFGLMEKDWEGESEAGKERIEEVVYYMLATYTGGLRGEELPLLHLKGMLEFWEEGRTHEIPHVMLTLIGYFKGEEGICYHCLPLADKTRTGFPVRL